MTRVDAQYVHCGDDAYGDDYDEGIDDDDGDDNGDDDDDEILFEVGKRIPQ